MVLRPGNRAPSLFDSIPPPPLAIRQSPNPPIPQSPNRPTTAFQRYALPQYGTQLRLPSQPTL